MPVDLSVSSLYRIMARLGELRDVPPSRVSTLELENLVDSGIQFADDIQRRLYIHRHLEFLRDCGYLYPYGTRMGEVASGLKLTADGQAFVQPELAEFGRPVLPAIVNYVEQKIEISMAPTDQKQTWKYKLREAVAKRAIDAIVDLAAELITRSTRGW